MVKQRLRYDGRFYGARLNLESVPRLPAIGVRYALDDPLRRPWLFVWRRDERSWVNSVAKVAEAVRVAVGDWAAAPYPRGPFVDVRDVRQLAEAPSPALFMRTRYRPMPRGTGRELLLVCHSCDTPKRFLYRWARTERGRARTIQWSCRACAGLRFASEGQCPDGFGFGFPRQEPWPPYIYPLDPRILEGAMRTFDSAESCRGSWGEVHGFDTEEQA